MKIYGFEDRCNISGINIKRIREQKQITQTELAARLQVRGVQLNQNGICRIEKGKRLVADYEIKILADALGVTIEELLALPGDFEQDI